LVEYIIHLLRLKVLHHQPLGMTIEQVREKLENYLQGNQIQAPEQIQRTVAHICARALSSLMVGRE
jgi:DNA-binding transcriptional MerR regulator